MPRSEEENQRLREEQAERIRNAASKVFAHKGLAATKITDIAAAADVSYGLVYHYFSNKEELFAQLVERAMRGTVQIIQRAQKQPGTSWDRLTLLIQGLLEGLQEEPETFMVVLQALTNEAIPPQVQQMVQQYSRMSEEVFRTLILEGQATGHVAAGDPEKLATTLMACISGLAMSAAFSTIPPSSFPDAEYVLRILKL